MKNRHTNRLSMSGLVLLASSLFGAAQAQDILVDSSILDQAMDVLGDKYAESAVAQEEITRLANEASSTFEEFKRANDNLESLLVLNAGYRRQIAAQEEQIATLDESIASVEEVTREIPLLMEKMLSALDQFISLIIHSEWMSGWRDSIRARCHRQSDVSIAEKFRQVLVMYQTEAALVVPMKHTLTQSKLVA